MLVLSRKYGERILIGENISVTVVRIGPNTVRLGIKAPRDLKIIREELVIHGSEAELDALCDGSPGGEGHNARCPSPSRATG
jgi:carbon storage regulator